MKQRRSRRLGSGRLVAAATAAILVVAVGGVGPTAASGSEEPQTGGTLIVAGGPDVLWMDPAAAEQDPEAFAASMVQDADAAA